MFSFLIFLNPVITHSGPTQVLSTPWFTRFMLPPNCPAFCHRSSSQSQHTMHVFTASCHHQLDGPVETKVWCERTGKKAWWDEEGSQGRPLFPSHICWFSKLEVRLSLLRLPPGPCLGISAVTVAWVYFYTLSNSHGPCCPAVERGLFCLSLRVSPSPAALGSQLESFGWSFVSRERVCHDLLEI